MPEKIQRDFPELFEKYEAIGHDIEKDISDTHYQSISKYWFIYK